MKKVFTAFALLILIFAVQNAGAVERDCVVLEDFSRYKVGRFPSKWQQRRRGAEKVYKIRKEGEKKYLEAVDSGKSIQIFRRVKWDSKTYPIAKWEWRVKILPKDAREDDMALNDSAAALYVIFPRDWFIPRVIKYVWSTSLPVGTETKGSGKTWIVVKASGEKNIGKWVTFAADVRKDFSRLFKMKPQDPVAIGFLTDANATHSKAAADYGTVYACKAAEEPPQKK